MFLSSRCFVYCGKCFLIGGSFTRLYCNWKKSPFGVRQSFIPEKRESISELLKRASGKVEITISTVSCSGKWFLILRTLSLISDNLVSGISDSRVQKSLFISKTDKELWGDIDDRIALVKNPCHHQSSMIRISWVRSILLSVFFILWSLNLAIAPVWRGWSKNCLINDNIKSY